MDADTLGAYDEAMNLLKSMQEPSIATRIMLYNNLGNAYQQMAARTESTVPPTKASDAF